jgi:AcrR family transcriptional regulator
MSPSRQYAKGVSKREEILRSALEVFAQKGYLKTSIRDLAEAANLSQAGLLHYFGSKEELLVAIIARREELNVAAGVEHDPLDHFFAVIRKNVDVPGHGHLFATMSTAAIAEDHPAHEFFVERYRNARERLIGSLRQRQEEGALAPDVDVTVLASVLIGAADGLQVQWLVDDTVDMPAAVEYLWSLIERTPPRGT